MSDLLAHMWLGVLAVFQGPELFSLFGAAIPATPVMVLAGFLLGVAVGATPGLAGPVAMAISLPILISFFGFNMPAMLPVLGFLVALMKGATLGGAVPAILFNTPGTPDAYMTAVDGYPMARKGQAAKALRVAHFASASGDTLSDIVLFICAPFLAVTLERVLDLPEKTALLLLSLCFISAVMGGSVARGLIATGLGLLAASIGTGEDFYPRLSLGLPQLSEGFSISTTILGVLVLGEVFWRFERFWLGRRRPAAGSAPPQGDARLSLAERRMLLPVIGRSALIGTGIGALPGVGSSLAAMLGYGAAKRRQRRRGHPGAVPFGEGAPEGVAATESANSSVAGANLIPVLSLGIPGNVSAVFIVLAAETIDGLSPGPTAFRINAGQVNPELVIVFGLFTSMVLSNMLNWVIGARLMRALGVMARVPVRLLMPVILLITLTGIYLQEMRFSAMVAAIGFGMLGYGMRHLGISPLPFAIAFILAERLESTSRQAYSATGGDAFFLFSSPISILLMLGAVLVLILSARAQRGAVEAVRETAGRNGT